MASGATSTRRTAGAMSATVTVMTGAPSRVGAHGWLAVTALCRSLATALIRIDPSTRWEPEAGFPSAVCADQHPPQQRDADSFFSFSFPSIFFFGFFFVLNRKIVDS